MIKTAAIALTLILALTWACNSPEPTATPTPTRLMIDGMPVSTRTPDSLAASYCGTVLPNPPQSNFERWALELSTDLAWSYIVGMANRNHEDFRNGWARRIGELSTRAVEKSRPFLEPSVVEEEFRSEGWQYCDAWRRGEPAG